MNDRDSAEPAVQPYLQPRKPVSFDELLGECAMAALTHDQPRRFVAKRFAEQARAKEFHER